MNKLKGWQRGWAYFMMLAIIGLASLTYGLARLEQVPPGREVVGQAIAAKDQQTVTGAVSEAGTDSVQQSPKNDTSVYESSTSDSDKSTIRPEETNKADADKQEQKAKLSVKDFPSPATGEHIREVGNYYSENLDTYLFHAGTDYALPEGAVIRATHEGKVTLPGLIPFWVRKWRLTAGRIGVLFMEALKI